MKLTVNKALHSRYALLKAAYHFTDEYYVLLDQDESSYYELVAQSTREAILEKTSSLRELILARAFASTIIDDKQSDDSSVSDANDNEIDKSLFKDWYEE